MGRVRMATDEFELYEMLGTLARVSERYTNGQEFVPAINELRSDLANRRYRVGIVGEFRRGKSSLVNALLGTEVVPTDILPTTAVPTRVVYGEERHAVVDFKDGHRTVVPLDSLVDYATKLGSNGGELAQTVREVCVIYPSVFCRNNIELVDTPGLNDDELMTSVTYRAIREVDAVVMVIAAGVPLGISEQELLMKLIGEPGIRHIVFVLNKMDLLRNHAEQERVMQHTRERLQKQTLSRAESLFVDNDELLDKARSVFTNPNLFGVSALLATRGFLSDDEDMLDESNFPRFKEELLALLTSYQSQDVPVRVHELACQVATLLPVWQSKETESVPRSWRKPTIDVDAVKELNTHLSHAMSDLDETLDSYGFDPVAGFSGVYMQQMLVRPFITQLASLSESGLDNQRIAWALRAGEREVTERFGKVQSGFLRRVQRGMKDVESHLGVWRRMLGLPDDALNRRLEHFYSASRLPEYRWPADAMPSGNLIRLDVIEIVERKARGSMEAYNRCVLDYLALWRRELFAQVREDLRYCDTPQEYVDPHSMSQLTALEHDFERHSKQVAEICDAVSACC